MPSNITFKILKISLKKKILKIWVQFFFWKAKQNFIIDIKYKWYHQQKLHSWIKVFEAQNNQAPLTIIPTIYTLRLATPKITHTLIHNKDSIIR